MNKKSHIAKSKCPIAHALDIIGDRWTLLVIRELMFSEKHEFGEFLKAPEQIATNILTDRIKKLLCAGVIGSIEHPSNKTKKLYYLTEKGAGLAETMVSIILWAEKHLGSALPPSILERIKKDKQQFIQDITAKIHKWNKEHVQPSQEI